MTPDLSRETFHPLKHYTRVVQQQGRVQLDSDWNEQAEIFLHTVRQMFTDLVGPAAGVDSNSFAVGLFPGTGSNPPTDLTIGAGRYYVHGIAAHNRDGTTYSKQLDLDVTNDLQDFASVFPFVVYLDVWEAPVTAFDDPDLREPALGGPDTTARTKVAWAVHVEPTWYAIPPGGTPVPAGSGTTGGPSPTPTPTPTPNTFPTPPAAGSEFQGLNPTSPAWAPRPRRARPSRRGA